MAEQLSLASERTSLKSPDEPLTFNVQPWLIYFPYFPAARILIVLSTGDDPFWEAVDTWSGLTNDLEWYDLQQVTTRDSQLVITMDSTPTTQPGLMVRPFFLRFPLPIANNFV
jgi:hypothetical protein